MVGRVVDRFRIVAPLGEGGMGSVWRAEDELLRRPVAIKFLAPELARSERARRRFLQEARAASMLDHPGVATVYAAGECDGEPYIAFSLVDGETVSERAAKCPFSLDDGIRMGVAAAEALGHAHGRGVVHRDVTARNVMLGRDGRVFLVDFGLALIADHTRLTRDGTAVGTLAYMAPEVLLGKDADPRSDLYGLGVVLYQALTGRLPFEAQRLEPLMYAILNETVTPPSERRRDLPAWIDRVILTALARKPEERYQDADAMIADLGGPASVAGTSRSTTIEIPRRHASFETSPRTLAVLPFRSVDLTPGGDAVQTDLFSRGLAEAISASLAKAPDLRVIPPLALPAVVDAQGAIALGAGLVLAGVVRREGSTIRVSYTLMDAVRNEQLAADTIEGSVSNLLALEDRLVGSVAAALEIDLEDRESVRVAPREQAHHARYLQALGYLQRSDNEASVDGAIALLEGLLPSEDAPVYAALGRAYVHKYRLTSERRWANQAATSCRRAIDLDPQAPEVMVTLGELHNATGRHREAVADFGRALELREQFPEALLGLAIAYTGLNDFATAEEHCQRTIAARPGSWNGYNQLGLVYFKQGAYARAAEPWRIVTMLSPDNIRGLSNLAAAYFHMDRFEDAIRTYRRALEIQPTGVAWTGLGTVLYYRGDLEEAEKAFERGAALKPLDPTMWGNLASVRRRLPGREAEFREALDRAIALVLERLQVNPSNAEDWAWLACWRADRGMRDGSLEAVEKALSLAPRDVTIMAQAGIAYTLLQERERALHWLGEAMRQGYGVERLTRDPDLQVWKDDPEFRRIVAERPGRAS